jgi:hypothetical protein
MERETCPHLSQAVAGVKRSGDGCEECLETGMRWVQLRMCLVCGHVGCCDSSQGKHATAHFHHSHHPVMQSIEPGATWGWCYLEEKMLELS